MSLIGSMFFGGRTVSRLVYTNIQQRSAARRKALAGKPWKFPRMGYNARKKAVYKATHK